MSSRLRKLLKGDHGENLSHQPNHYNHCVHVNLIVALCHLSKKLDRTTSNQITSLTYRRARENSSFIAQCFSAATFAHRTFSFFLFLIFKVLFMQVKRINHRPQSVNNDTLSQAGRYSHFVSNTWHRNLGTCQKSYSNTDLPN